MMERSCLDELLCTPRLLKSCDGHYCLAISHVLGVSENFCSDKFFPMAVYLFSINRVATNGGESDHRHTLRIPDL